jgi:hypothetical protein
LTLAVFNERYVLTSEQSDDFIITGESPSVEVFTAIGKFIVTFGKLDAYASTCMSVLMGAEPELVSMIANSLQSKARFDTLRDIFAYKLGSANKIRAGLELKNDKQFRELDKLFDEIQKANDIRNEIVHSEWSIYFPDASKAHRLRWEKSKDKPGWPVADYDLVSVKDLEGKIRFIEKVTDELSNFFSQNFGDYIRQLYTNNNNEDVR